MAHDVTKPLQYQCCVGALPHFPCFRNPKVIMARQNTGNTTSPYETACINSCLKVFKQLHEKNANEHVAVHDIRMQPACIQRYQAYCRLKEEVVELPKQVHAHTYVYTYTCIYVHVRMYVRTCTYVYVYTYVSISISINDQNTTN